MVSAAPRRPSLKTIPFTDAAFRQFVERTLGRSGASTPSELEARLRRLLPRVLVRARGLSNEAPAWYVYRDGTWQPPDVSWWTAADAARMVVSPDGWVTEANDRAREVLGLTAQESRRWQFIDFALPDTVEDAEMLFRILVAGHALTGTILIRPVGGDAIACDVHATFENGSVVAILRPAAGIAPVVVEPGQRSSRAMTQEPLGDPPP